MERRVDPTDERARVLQVSRLALTATREMGTLIRLSPLPMPCVSPAERLGALACLLIVSAIVSAGCASVPTPPFRDYEVRNVPSDAPAAADTMLTTRLRGAAVAAGWQPVPSLSAGIVSTASQPVPGGGFSRTTAALDLVPVDAPDGAALRGAEARFVRVVVRAERRGILGGRSKVYALDSRLRDLILAPITEALAARGLVALGTPRDRDEDVTDD